MFILPKEILYPKTKQSPCKTCAGHHYSARARDAVWECSIFAPPHLVLLPLNLQDGVPTAITRYWSREVVGVTKCSPSQALLVHLQDGVPTAINTLLEAGVRVWMITGDKQETAINIGVSCKLVSNPESIMILNVNEKQEQEECVREARAKLTALLESTGAMQVPAMGTGGSGLGCLGGVLGERGRGYGACWHERVAMQLPGMEGSMVLCRSRRPAISNRLRHASACKTHEGWLGCLGHCSRRGMSSTAAEPGVSLACRLAPQMVRR